MSGAMAPGAGWLPAGPWPVERRYTRGKRIRGWLSRCLALAIALAFAGHAQGEIDDLIRDAAVVDDPAAIEVDARFLGRVESRWGFFPSYRGIAHYHAPDGTLHMGSVDFTTLVEIDTKAPLSVRFVPARPGDFVTSWAAEAIGARWLALAILAGVGLVLVSGSLWWIGSNLLAQAAVALAVGVDGAQHVGRLLAIDEGMRYGRLVHRRYVVEVATPDGPRKAYGVFKAKEGTACLVPPDGVLVVSSPLAKKQLLVLRHDLWPLQLPDDVRQAVLARLAAASGDAPA